MRIKKKRDLGISNRDAVCFDGPKASCTNEISSDTHPYVFQKKELYRNKLRKNMVVKRKL